MINSNSPIGLFDSGVGGLTVLKALKQILPNEQYVYLGDTARNPYGPKSQGTILQCSRECVSFLQRQAVKLIVVACNSASSAALPELEGNCDVPLVGVIEPVVRRAVNVTENNFIAVIGTYATVNSKAYVNSIHRLKPEAQVLSRACPLFVPLVEEGILEGSLVDLAIERYLNSLRGSGIDTLILGCTHYPLLKNSLVSYLGENVRIVGSGDAVAERVRDELEKRKLLRSSDKAARDRYFVTDTSEQFERLALPFLNRQEIKAVQVHNL